jgi:hypothetical protein
VPSYKSESLKLKSGWAIWLSSEISSAYRANAHVSS